MPKKFTGENSKAAVARARKIAAQEKQNYKKEKEIEDAYWKDDDKLVQKKLQRKVKSQKFIFVICHKKLYSLIIKVKLVLLVNLINFFEYFDPSGTAGKKKN